MTLTTGMCFLTPGFQPLGGSSLLIHQTFPRGTDQLNLNSFPPLASAALGAPVNRMRDGYRWLFDPVRVEQESGILFFIFSNFRVPIRFQ